MKVRKQYVGYESPRVHLWSLNYQSKLLHSFSGELDIEDIEDGEDLTLRP